MRRRTRRLPLAVVPHPGGVRSRPSPATPSPRSARAAPCTACRVKATSGGSRCWHAEGCGGAVGGGVRITAEQVGVGEEGTRRGRSRRQLVSGGTGRRQRLLSEPGHGAPVALGDRPARRAGSGVYLEEGEVERAGEVARARSELAPCGRPVLATGQQRGAPADVQQGLDFGVVDRRRRGGSLTVTSRPWAPASSSVLVRRARQRGARRTGPRPARVLELGGCGVACAPLEMHDRSRQGQRGIRASRRRPDGDEPVAQRPRAARAAACRRRTAGAPRPAGPRRRLARHGASACAGSLWPAHQRAARASSSR